MVTWQVVLLEHSYILDLSAVYLTHKMVGPEFQGKQSPAMGGAKETFLSDHPGVTQAVPVPPPELGPWPLHPTMSALQDSLHNHILQTGFLTGFTPGFPYQSFTPLDP